MLAQYDYSCPALRCVKKRMRLFHGVADIPAAGTNQPFVVTLFVLSVF